MGSPARAGPGGSPAQASTARRGTRLEHGPVAARVSEAPEGSVIANRRNLLAHTRVLQQVVESECVLPMQFGVVMPSDAAVADDLLAAHEEDLCERLELFDGLVEV